MENSQVMKKKIAIAILAIIGLITTIKLAIIYYEANFNPYALASFCSVNEFIDCDGIAKTSESQFLGIPLAYWGIFLYAFIFLMLIVDKLKNILFLKFLEVFKNPLDYIATLGIISFVISIILLFLSLFEIKKLCILCAATYFLNLFIAMIATDFNNGGFVRSFKQSVQDFIDAIKVKKYLIAFICVMIAAIAGLAYTRISYVFAPQVKKSLEFKEFIKAKKNKYAVSGNILGAKEPKVIVYVYSDYQCPICPAQNIMMHKLVKEFQDVQIVHRNLPLDTECNAHLVRPFHKGSCVAARYELAAAKQGKSWDMSNILFQYKPKTEEEILKLAKGLHLDLNKLQEDANSIEISQELRKEIDEAYKKGINGTPTVLIGKDAFVGIRPYNEYKEWFIKEGGTKK